MDASDFPMIRRLLATMKANTSEFDAPGQAMIRKYTRLLREAEREQRGQ